MNDITFYQRFEADILAGRKTITIRDKSESHFKAGDILCVGRFEDNQYFCTIEVLSVSPITLDELTEQHAKQENMGLEELKEVIRGIYPGESEFFVIEFKLLNLGKYMENNEVTVEKNDNFISRIKKYTKFIIIAILGAVIVTSYRVYDTLQSIKYGVWSLEDNLSSLNNEISYKTNDDYNYSYKNENKELSLKENLVLVKKLDDKVDRLDNKIDRLDKKIDELNSEFSLTNNEKDNKPSSSYSYNNIFDDKKQS